MKFDLKNIVRPNIWNLKAYSSARSEFDLYDSTQNELTLIDANENPAQPQLQQLANAKGLNRYPDPLQSDLKAAIAEKKQVSTEQVFVGNGSDEAIDLLYRIFCEPGKDKAVICPPTYGMYEVSADINNVEILKIDLTADFELNMNAIIEQIDSDTRIKLLWICSPNNPTGNAPLKADLKHDWHSANYTKGGMMDLPFQPEFEQELLDNQRKLDRLFGRFRGIVVVDEAYQDFTENMSFINRLDDYPNLVVLQTMSKAQGLAGARVGFAFASKEIIGLFNKTKPPYNVNQLSQTAALEALKNDEQTQKSILQLNINRKLLASSLDELDFVEQVYPSEANFILAKLKQATQVYNYLKEHDIIVRNRSSQIPNTLRFTVGSTSECEKLIAALRKYQSR